MSGVDYSSLANILKNIKSSETNNYYQDTITVNVYPSEGMDESAVANQAAMLVVEYLTRGGVSLG